ncbi:MAG: AzlD domain-containing protein [Synergistaceae bacterium]|nr:AzlD domain-containing protein [Synergistaceae bacterium]
MPRNVYLYLFIMAAVTYLIRVLPLTVIRGEIKNKRVRAFLYYVPYVTLAVMTFPAIIDATGSPLTAVAALLAAVGLSWFGGILLQVSILSCAVVFILDKFVP